MRVLCHLFGHRWQLMTGGRVGFVRWYRCRRGCGETKFVKGAFR